MRVLKPGRQGRVPEDLRCRRHGIERCGPVPAEAIEFIVKIGGVAQADWADAHDGLDDARSGDGPGVSPAQAP